MWHKKRLAASILLMAGLSFSQETLSSVQRQLDRVEREIEREKELHKQERKQSSEFKKSRSQKLAAMKQQIEKSKKSRVDWEAKLKLSQGQKAALKRKLKLLGNKESELLTSVGKEAEQLKSFVATDFPHRTARRNSDLETLTQGLESGQYGPQEALNRFFSVLENSMEFAYGVEAYNGTYVTKSGTSTDGVYLRVGAALLVFAGYDNKQVAYLIPSDTSGYDWIDEGISTELRQKILHAVKVAEGKETPELVYLPVVLRQESSIRSSSGLPEPSGVQLDNKPTKTAPPKGGEK